MASDRTRSLQDIRRDTERTREGLTTTVSQLQSAVSDVRDKLRPQAITTEVSGYIKSRGEELVHNLTDAARRNPMQAVAVGASVAYPLMRIARSIPLPVLMMGAGLFLAGSKQGRDLTQQASNTAGDLADQVRRRAHDLGDQVTQATSDAKDYAADTAEQIKGSATGTMEAVQDQIGSTAQRAKDAADSTGASIADRADDARNVTAAMTDKLKTQASQAAGSVGDTVASAVQAGQDYAAVARERLVESGIRAGRTMQETVEQHPLLTAGAGLLIGGLIASALPSFDLEDDLMGDTSDKVRRRAYEAANETLGNAKSAADEVLSNVARKAEDEGLTPDGMADGMQEIGQRLQRVAERGITTAFEPEGNDDLQSHSRGTENG